MILCAKPWTLKVMHVMSPKCHDMHTLTCILGRKPRGTGVLLLLLLLLVQVLVVVVVVVAAAAAAAIFSALFAKQLRSLAP